MRGKVQTLLVEDEIDLDFRLFWTLSCTAGTGGCEGTLKVKAPRGHGFKVRLPKKHPVACKGKCAGVTEGKARVALRTDLKKFAPRHRRNKAYTIKVKRTCRARS